MAVIRFESVTQRFADTTALSAVDLTLTEHRIGIIGPNGGGKSTLARLINGLQLPTEGSVSLDDADTRRDGPAVRKRVGFVFSDPDRQILMPTVIEDVEFSLRRLRLPRAERSARARTVLAEFGLAEQADQPAHTLSGGQKQLLALAAVLVTDPDVVVADEPTTLLDLRNTRTIAARLAALRQQLVVVTHQLDLLADFDRVLLVDGGTIVADGHPAQVIAAYRALLE